MGCSISEIFFETVSHFSEERTDVVENFVWFTEDFTGVASTTAIFCRCILMVWLALLLVFPCAKPTTEKMQNKKVKTRFITLITSNTKFINDQSVNQGFKGLFPKIRCNHLCAGNNHT